jgi:hypothetical protein
VKEYPQHSRGSLNTDGAGCYSGVGLLARIGYMYLHCNFRFDEVGTGETGGGKSTLDGGFGNDKCNLVKFISQNMGRLDAIDKESLIKLLQEIESKSSTRRVFTYEVKTHSRLSVEQEPIQSAALKKASVQKNSSRHFIYDSETYDLIGFNLDEQSGLIEDNERSLFPIDSIWPVNIPVSKRLMCARVECNEMTPCLDDSKTVYNTREGRQADMTLKEAKKD